MKHSTISSSALLLFCYFAMVMGQNDSTNKINTRTTSTNLRSTSISTTSSSNRELSIWSSFLSFVKCPPGPLGDHCRPKNSGSGSSDGSGGGGSSGGSGRSSGSSSGGDSSGSSSGSSSTSSSTSSSGGDSNGSGRSSYNVNGDSSSSNNTNEKTFKDTAASAVAKNGLLGWFMILGGLAMVGMVVGGVVYSKSRGAVVDTPESKTGRYHELSGAVKKRNKAFKEAMRIKLGWRKGDSSSGLRESLA